jgi:hypothetical protein
VGLQPNCVLISDPIDYSFPPAIRKLLPPTTIDLCHNFARISTSGKTTFATTKLRGLDTLWHNTAVDITTLRVIRRIKANVFKVKHGSEFAIGKVARFEFEIPYIEAETRVYRDIDGHGVGPKFLAHLLENGRPTGMWIEYLDGQRPSKDDFETCSRVLCGLHSLGWAHRDINRDNFIIVGPEAKLIDFEESGPATEQERKI